MRLKVFGQKERKSLAFTSEFDNKLIGRFNAAFVLLDAQKKDAIAKETRSLMVKLQQDGQLSEGLIKTN